MRLLFIFYLNSIVVSNKVTFLFLFKKKFSLIKKKPKC